LARLAQPELVIRKPSGQRGPREIRGGVVQLDGAGGEALAVGGGAEAVVGLEAAGEAALVGPADRAPDAGDRLVGVQQEKGSVLSPELG
jgi:hypothetical protein